MTDHKFTDEEVIRALECCRSIDLNDCEYCPYSIKRGECVSHLADDALDLINRQRAEIEGLKGVIAAYEDAARERHGGRRAEMSINDSLEKAKTYIQEAFAECYEYTEVAVVFYSIVQEAKNQVRFICQRIAEEEKESKNDRT